nr:DNA helicase [Tanacetum cinerariifolium]
EFQKRGLPHCHTLLWLDESVRIHKEEDIDVYILAELIPEDIDPECYRVVSELMMHGPCGLTYLSASYIGTPDDSDPQNSSWIDIPDEYCIPNDENRTSNLINFIYDDKTLRYPSAVKLQDKTIVRPKNETADVINAKILSMISGTTRTYISYDEAIPHGHDEGEVELLYPTEYLNTLSFPGLPPHMLELKVGTPIMLLRNVNIVGGLCNETRLIVTQLLSKVIEA